MFHPGRDEVPFFGIGVERSQDRRIVTLRPATGEDDLRRVRSQEIRHLLPRLVHLSWQPVPQRSACWRDFHSIRKNRASLPPRLREPLSLLHYCRRKRFSRPDLLHLDLIAHEFPQLRFDVLFQGHFRAGTEGTFSSQSDIDLVPFDINQIDIPAIGLEGRDDLSSQGLLNQLDLLDIRQFLLLRPGGRLSLSPSLFSPFR